MAVGEPQAFLRQAVDVRRQAGLRPVARKVAVADVIGVDDDDIGRRGPLRDGGGRRQEDDPAKPNALLMVASVGGQPARADAVLFPLPEKPGFNIGHVRDRQACPVERQPFFLGIGEGAIGPLPSQPHRQRLQTEGGRDRQIEILDEAEHRQVDRRIGPAQDLGIQTVDFIPHEQGDRTVERQFVDRQTAGAGVGDELVAPPVMIVEAVERRLGTGEATDREPLIRSEGDLAVHLETELPLDRGDILDAEGVTAPQDRADVVRLVDVVENDGDPAGAVAQTSANLSRRRWVRKSERYGKIVCSSAERSDSHWSDGCA